MNDNFNEYIQDPNELDPDYNLWWAQDNLSEIEIYLIFRGINPDNYKKLQKINSVNSGYWTEKEEEFRSLYNERMPSSPIIIKNINFWKDYLGWDCSKESIVDIFYDNHFIIPLISGCIQNEKLKSFLKKNNLLPKKYDHYLVADYSYNYDNINAARNITSKEEAIGFILGLDSEYLLKYLNIRNDEEIWKIKPAEDRFFLKEYQKKVDEIYDKNVGYIGAYERLSKYQFKEFESYINVSYNDGVIFNEKVEIQLNRLGFELNYDESSWLIKKYKHWKEEKQFCTLKEGFDLYVGEFGSNKTLDLRDSRLEFSYIGNAEWAFKKSEHDEGETIALKELLDNDIRSGKVSLKKYTINGQEKFLINGLFEWLIKTCPKFKPNKALLDVFELHNAFETPSNYESNLNKSVGVFLKNHIENNVFPLANREPYNNVTAGIYYLHAFQLIFSDKLTKTKFKKIWQEETKGNLNWSKKGKKKTSVESLDKLVEEIKYNNQQVKLDF